MFEGRKLLIATKHAKETVMAPLLEKALGVICLTPPALDTDTLGTFTGEIEREGSPLDTLRRKCHMGLAMGDYDLVVANEGSFGPHPSIPFVRADDELVMLLDTKHNLEIVARSISTNTNHDGTHISSERALTEFANKVGFPSHGLILRKDNQSSTDIIKNIKDWDYLYESYAAMESRYGSAYIETDMRAMHNPTRMEVIAEATQKLIDKVRSTCPKCHTPGFGITTLRPGLPCSACGFPTRSTLSHIYTCAACTHTLEDRYPHDKKYEQPMYCNYCNP